MPVPNYFTPPRKPFSLTQVTGGLTGQQILDELDRGARFVVFRYTISGIIATWRKNSTVFFIRPGESILRKSLPYTAVTLVCGWWGIPFGILYSIQTLYRNFRGGADVSHLVRSKLSASGNPKS
jgi:hypothetical protein